MKIIRDLHQANLGRETILTIGTFDGLHLGHQDLLKRLILRARQTGRLSGVVTFDPPPRAVLSPASNAICLTSTEDKVEMLKQWGLNLVAIVPFTLELAHTSARDFVQALCEHLNMTELWIGENFALGRGREGDVSALKELGKAMGFHVQVIALVSNGEVVISSSQIRQLLNTGQVREAARMLGRYYQLKGRVVAGTGLGRQLGFPTANLQLPQHCALPANGVYAVYVTIKNRRYLGAANIGLRPTFGGGEHSVEVHVLNFNGNLYGEKIAIQFVDRLRAERRFPNADALRAQIEKDIIQVQEILDETVLRAARTYR